MQPYALRLALLTLLFLGLSFFFIVTTPWRRWFGKPPTYAEVIAQGEPLVAAIEQFKGDTRLWPEYLDDLVPHYLPKAPAPAWYYTVTPEGPALSILTAQRRTHVGYDFDPVHPQWRVFGEVDNRVLPAAGPVTRPAPDSAATLANELAELKRRIAREPALLDHHRAQASLLRALNRMDEARAAITRAAADLPESFWPPLALAALDPKHRDVEAFAAWVAARSSFTHFYYLALLHRAAGADAAAKADIQKSLACPIAVAPDDPETRAFYLWDMTRYALQQGDYPLALQLTDAWQKEASAGRIDESSYLPLRAAAQLAMKNDAAAQSDLARFAALKTPAWARNLDALRAAVAHHDHGFHYDPGPSPPAYRIFQLPQ